MKKSIQIFAIIEYQKNVLNLFIYLSITLIDFVFRTGKRYYAQVFLEECKYVVKEKMMPEYITNDTEISSNSNRENSDEKIFMKKIQMKKILKKKIRYRIAEYNTDIK